MKPMLGCFALLIISVSGTHGTHAWMLCTQNRLQSYVFFFIYANNSSEICSIKCIFYCFLLFFGVFLLCELISSSLRCPFPFRCHSLRRPFRLFISFQSNCLFILFLCLLSRHFMPSFFRSLCRLRAGVLRLSSPFRPLCPLFSFVHCAG